MKKNEENINKEKKLIYKAIKNSDNASKYLELCDNKNPLITLIKIKKIEDLVITWSKRVIQIILVIKK